jgi:hypothetical protein
MADCMFHGYSGGPGSCDGCESERKRGLAQGESDFRYDQEVTTDAYRRGNYTTTHAPGSDIPGLQPYS